jgi:hypothetical protein
MNIVTERDRSEVRPSRILGKTYATAMIDIQTRIPDYGRDIRIPVTSHSRIRTVLRLADSHSKPSMLVTKPAEIALSRREGPSRLR